MNNDLVISQTDGRPMYLQIIEQIRQRIAVGEWAPGERIPSIRELATAVNVSVITIKRAYLELEREGVIFTQHGKGSFVTEDPELGTQLVARELTSHLTKVIELAATLGWDLDEIEETLRKLYDRKDEERP